MADIESHIVSKLEVDPQLRAVPVPVIREIVMLTFHELMKTTDDETILANLVHGYDWAFCEACGKMEEHERIKRNDNYEQFCIDCYRGFGHDEEEG